jgi:hypothetical protein
MPEIDPKSVLFKTLFATTGERELSLLTRKALPFDAR